MHKILRLVVPSITTLAVVGFVVARLAHSHMAVLTPAGTIAAQQRNLLLATTMIMLLIVIPVFGLTFFIAWKYRAGNDQAEYQPEWDHSLRLETLWWGLPSLIILVLSIVAWNSSHNLDPSRALNSNMRPLTIQVIALQWKWLFLYPEQQIASLNYLQFPVNRPVNFQISADAPMNSFWIPQLGGQIYAMAGMTTQLHLIADRPGDFRGSSANLSGEHFAAMQFTVHAGSTQDFDTWVSDIHNLKISSSSLTLDAYDVLARPGVPRYAAVYNSYDSRLYHSVLMKYMGPRTGANDRVTGTMPTMQGMTYE